MAFDRQGYGLTSARILIGVFFFFEGIGKYRWFADSSVLAGQLAGWLQAAPAGSVTQWYLQHVCIPGAAVFARLVPVGEIGVGLALVAGFWTPGVALLAFALALNFQVASGAVFRYSFLTSGYGLPVLGSTLALAIGGVRLPWSLRG